MGAAESTAGLADEDFAAGGDVEAGGAYGVEGVGYADALEVVDGGGSSVGLGFDALNCRAGKVGDVCEILPAFHFHISIH